MCSMISDALKVLQSYGGDDSLPIELVTACEFSATPVAKESSLVMAGSTNRGEMMCSKLVAPFAKAASRNAVNRDWLTECIVQHRFPSLLRRSQYLMIKSSLLPRRPDTLGAFLSR